MFLQTLRRAPRAFKVLVASALIENIAFGLVFPILTSFMADDLGISETLTGVALAGYTVAGVPAMVLGGMLADRIGRRPVLLMSLGLMSITLASYYFATDFFTLLVIVLADSFVGTLYMPAANAMIADVIPCEDRPQAYSTLRIAWNTGFFAGPTIGILIVSLWSVRTLFLFGSVILAAAFVMNLFLIPETKPTCVTSEDITFRKMMAVSRNRAFLTLCVLYAALWVFLSQWMSVLTLFVTRDLELSRSTLLALFSVNGLMVVTLQLWVTSKMVKLRRSVVLLSGQLIASMGFFSLFFIHDLVGVFASIAVVTIGEIIYMSIIGAITADMSPEEERGLYMGFSGFLQSIGMGIGLFVGMLLLDVLDEGRVIWIIFGAFGAITCIGYPFFARMIGPEKDHPQKYGYQSATKRQAAKE